jgi:hypothetical protein
LFNTGHPHTHVVIRGRDDQGRDLVIARDYIGHGVRARAQGLITLELGPETDLERTQKLFNETGQERLTRLDRSLLGRAKDGVLVITAAEEQDPVQQTLRIGRLKTLERLGLAQERQQGVWELDGKLESKLRRLGDRADKFRTMQQVLKELGIDRGAAAMALFERGPRKVPLIGKVIGVGMVDEITDHTWAVVDALDGRVHYADLGRIKPADAPHRGMLVALAGDETMRGKPTSVPRLEVLSAVEIGRLATYDGPTWLDEAIVGRFQVQKEVPGLAAELRQALADRSRWLGERGLADVSALKEVAPKPDMMRSLRQRETAHLAETLSRQLNAIHVPHEPGSQISGVYERAIATPTGKLAVIRSADTFTLAPWKPALEAMRGRAVMGLIGPSRVMWTLDRGRALPDAGECKRARSDIEPSSAAHKSGGSWMRNGPGLSQQHPFLQWTDVARPSEVPPSRTFLRIADPIMDTSRLRSERREQDHAPPTRSEIVFSRLRPSLSAGTAKQLG